MASGATLLSCCYGDGRAGICIEDKMGKLIFFPLVLRWNGNIALCRLKNDMSTKSSLSSG
ncbi:hypothetical protein [Oryza sativa Japonica Group]|uniref:Uncharacterized protein n=1 Tax=Oryza sativa subsp. japonica TaxID=39947 RepID=Q5ZBB2_ORYSJ|nr:hypothetical protein [Oryza sativa Japonica Group]BAD53116.1 hypothetical protein [Oryza sativa Japonica Group]